MGSVPLGTEVRDVEDLAGSVALASMGSVPLGTEVAARATTTPSSARASMGSVPLGTEVRGPSPSRSWRSSLQWGRSLSEPK